MSGPSSDCGLFDVFITPKGLQDLETECSVSASVTEILFTVVYIIFSCWVVLSVLHWVRRGLVNDPPPTEFF